MEPRRPLFDARAQQRRVERAFRKPVSHGRLAAIAIALVWAAAAGYFFLVPSAYISRWTMILPTSNSSSTVSLDSIGQASTNPSQPFGTLQLSPKVIYREIASSDQVRAIAADILKVDPKRLARARVRSIDETSLLLFQTTGRSAQEAQSYGNALIQALNIQLDRLRKDEQEKREGIVRDNLKIYQANLAASQKRILDFQKETGLLSLNQFNETSSSAELLRRKKAEQRSEIERLSAEQTRLIARTGLQPQEAGRGHQAGGRSGLREDRRWIRRGKCRRT